MRKDGSYPSGHTAFGWAWALILTEIAPERADVILARGRAFGESRMVCNVHWYSDVVAGRTIGAAAVARLHAEPEFRDAVAAGRFHVYSVARVEEAIELFMGMPAGELDGAGAYPQGSIYDRVLERLQAFDQALRDRR